MNKEQVEKIATEVAEKIFFKKSEQQQFSSLNVPFHTHNGSDSSRINQNDIDLGNNYQVNITVTPGGQSIYIIQTPDSMSSLTFNGYAANNATVPATKRAVINGLVRFGNCFQSSQITTPVNTFDLSTLTQQSSFIQCANALYIDSTDLTKSRVSISGSYFIFATDDTGTAVVTGRVTDWSSRSITLELIASATWTYTGNIFIIK